MIGKQENDKVKRCPLCGGYLHDGDTAIPFLSGNKIVVVKDVPAEICDDCGEPYMKSHVVERIEELFDRLDDIKSEMSVVYYHAA